MSTTTWYPGNLVAGRTVDLQPGAGSACSFSLPDFLGVFRWPPPAWKRTAGGNTISPDYGRGMSLRSAGAPVTVIGRENFLPLAIYTSNHTSFMDTPVVFSSLPFQFRILAKQSLWKWPFIGWHLHRSGQIPVDEENGGGSIAGLNRAIKALKAGLPLFIFPEGGRTHDGRMQPFMRGPAFISIRSRVPLVPMALIGTYELLPIHTHHFRPRPVKLVIGQPIDPSGYTIRQADELTARLQSEIQQLYERHAGPGDLDPSLMAEIAREAK